MEIKEIKKEKVQFRTYIRRVTMKKTECALVKVRQISAKGQQCPEDYIFLIFRKVQFLKGIGFIKWFPTFL